MSVDIKVPPLPESVSEATVATWHKKPGDPVTRDENLVDLETDKVVLEVPSPGDGVLEECLKGEGETVTAEEVLGRIKEGAAASPELAPAAEASQPAEAEESAPEAPAGPAPATEAPAAEAQRPAPPAAQTSAEPGGARSAHADLDSLSPAVRRLVEQHALEPGRIPATGPGGRITKEDVLTYLDRQPSRQAESAAAPAAAPAAGAAGGERPAERVPMTRLRQRIAERLVEAQSTAAMLTTFNEADMQAVMDLRARYRERFEKAHDVRLGFMSFYVKAVVEALKRFPAVNASIDGTDIIYHGYYDIGIAVSSPRGLVVPVLRDADRLTFAEIEKQINDFGQRAREGKLAMDELTGGTFTITNGGVFGSLVSTPILNPPQSGILGLHKIQERPVAEDGQVVVRPMMYLAHTYDHRIIDGREAVQFLVAVKECIEDPARLMLEV